MPTKGGGTRVCVQRWRVRYSGLDGWPGTKTSRAFVSRQNALELMSRKGGQVEEVWI